MTYFIEKLTTGQSKQSPFHRKLYHAKFHDCPLHCTKCDLLLLAQTPGLSFLTLVILVRAIFQYLARMSKFNLRKFSHPAHPLFIYLVWTLDTRTRSPLPIYYCSGSKHTWRTTTFGCRHSLNLITEKNISAQHGKTFQFVIR